MRIRAVPKSRDYPNNRKTGPWGRKSPGNYESRPLTSNRHFFSSGNKPDMILLQIDLHHNADHADGVDK